MPPFIRQTPGTAYYFRVYLVSGMLGNVQSLANTLSPYAGKGPMIFTEDTADLEPIYTQVISNGQTYPFGGTKPMARVFHEDGSVAEW